MPVYVDPMMKCIPNRNWKWSESYHLYADTIRELKTFAVKLGLRPQWYQCKSKLCHFDLTRNLRYKALRLGAIDDVGRVEMRAIMKIERFRTKHRSKRK